MSKVTVKNCMKCPLGRPMGNNVGRPGFLCAGLGVDNVLPCNKIKCWMCNILRKKENLSSFYKVKRIGSGRPRKEK